MSRQQRLRQAERKLRQTLDLSSILNTAVLEVASLFDADQVGLLQYVEATHSFDQVATCVRDQAIARQPQMVLSHSTFPLSMQALQQGKSLLMELAQSATPEATEWLDKWSGNWLILPLSLQAQAAIDAEYSQSVGEQPQVAESAEQNTCWGLLAIALPGNGMWSSDAIAAAESLAIELSWAITQSLQHQELRLANEALQKLALSDGLTHLANRRRFDEHLNQEWQRLARDRKPLSLILCDLDHFKRYNDTFGHPAGDRCLIRIARALLNGPQRPADLVARYGGEEFAIILPDTNTHGAWRIAQKIHDSVRALKIEHADDNPEPYVTVTMGVSTVVPGHDNTPQTLLQAADLALYYAKQQGRNRTYINGHCNTVGPEQVMQQQLSAELNVMPQGERGSRGAEERGRNAE